VKFSGSTAEVYRSKRDGFGDKSEALVGTIPNVVLQPTTGLTGLQYQPVNGDFVEASNLTTLLWCPRSADVKLENRDRAVVDGHNYRVIGDRAWDAAHPATGTVFSHYAIEVEAVL
jgi:hypothetical protein